MTLIIKSNTIFKTSIGLLNPLNTMVSLIGLQKLLKLIAWAWTNRFKKDRLCVGVLQNDAYQKWKDKTYAMLKENRIFLNLSKKIFFRSSIKQFLKRIFFSFFQRFFFSLPKFFSLQSDTKISKSYFVARIFAELWSPHRGTLFGS